MLLESGKLENRTDKEDIEFRRALLSKHTQFMKMYMQHNNRKLAKKEFESVKSLFIFLNNAGETMSYYTPDDFERDSKQFEK